MTQETLREAVARAIKGIDAERQVDGYATEFLNGATDLSEWEREVIADAAIATMLERLRTPSERMVRHLNAACDTPDADLAWVFPVIAAAFQQENSDER